MPKGVWKDRDPAKRSEAAKKAAASRSRRAATGVPLKRPRGMAPLSDAEAARFREIGKRIAARAPGDAGFVAETPGAVGARVDAVLAAMEASKR